MSVSYEEEDACFWLVSLLMIHANANEFAREYPQLPPEREMERERARAREREIDRERERGQQSSWVCGATTNSHTQHSRKSDV